GFPKHRPQQGKLPGVLAEPSRPGDGPSLLRVLQLSDRFAGGLPRRETSGLPGTRCTDKQEGRLPDVTSVPRCPAHARGDELRPYRYRQFRAGEDLAEVPGRAVRWIGQDAEPGSIFPRQTGHDPREGGDRDGPNTRLVIVTALQ